jgi:hypothetical protein
MKLIKLEKKNNLKIKTKKKTFICLIFIQSELFGLAIRVSSWLRQKKLGGRSLMRCGSLSKIPTGIYRYRNDNHSSMKRRVALNKKKSD